MTDVFVECLKKLKKDLGYPLETDWDAGYEKALKNVFGELAVALESKIKKVDETIEKLSTSRREYSGKDSRAYFLAGKMDTWFEVKEWLKDCVKEMKK